MEKFTFFWSGPFSQWHPSPFEIDGVRYGCAEQYMMAEKARFFGDEMTEERIMGTTNPKAQKSFGRQVRGFQQDKWEAVARDIVKRGSRAKFDQNPGIKETLLATAGTTLVEASPYDRIWGIGLSGSDLRALDRKQWLGTNWLGEILTMVRDGMLAG